MQRLLRESGLRLSSRSDRQAEEGLKLVKELHAADASQFARSPWLIALLQRMETVPTQYLAHEYMNSSWAPCFHAEVAGAFADAKLEWVASANLVENFPDLTLSAEQRAVARRFDDPLLRELVKDICLERSLRHDVFVRGVRRTIPEVRDATLRDLSLALNISPDEMPFEADMPAGRAALSRSFYRPITEAMASGPCRVGDLLALPNLEGKRDNPAELIGILVGLDIAEPALRPGADPGPQAMRFNRVTMTSLMRTENMGRPIAAATCVLGTGAPCSLFDLYVMERVQAGEGEASIENWVGDIGRNLDIEGRGRLREVLQKAFACAVLSDHARPGERF